MFWLNMQKDPLSYTSYHFQLLDIINATKQTSDYSFSRMLCIFANSCFTF